MFSNFPSFALFVLLLDRFACAMNYIVCVMSSLSFCAVGSRPVSDVNRCRYMPPVSVVCSCCVFVRVSLLSVLGVVFLVPGTTSVILFGMCSDVLCVGVRFLFRVVFESVLRVAVCVE